MEKDEGKFIAVAAEATVRMSLGDNSSGCGESMNELIP